ncbi:hypothetical protein HR059_03035 [Sinorhizobium meliloti WSM1022]|uniref:Uncharacterized protein n=2 Tax=Sinorhizobium TaxID=28105 RepID=H0G617_RHIML|nr:MULTISPECIES: hypothetical protein [Sinorhizobium]ASP79430.1 hypothetical protein CDO27_16550 [Sinorhizobium meliloti]ASQ04816.1 hypothetical protein CDO23_13220 [Sinorhizobium meliloti]EHK75242.1 hypothetical protein SM0020_24670 [Sinorhizobium meliloti CCNWSX0020]MCM5692236.1 hypothetical protein [Sinorhizobium meliloti]MCO6420522.1 hypothetical protein [Sinorhizobium meliloti]
MNTPVSFINVIAFTALFATHASAGPIERPSGVRRALQIYAGELSSVRAPAPKWRLDGSEHFCSQRSDQLAPPCGRRTSATS